MRTMVLLGRIEDLCPLHLGHDPIIILELLFGEDACRSLCLRICVRIEAVAILCTRAR